MTITEIVVCLILGTVFLGSTFAVYSFIVGVMRALNR